MAPLLTDGAPTRKGAGGTENLSGLRKRLRLRLLPRALGAARACPFALGGEPLAIFAEVEERVEGG